MLTLQEHHILIWGNIGMAVSKKRILFCDIDNTDSLYPNTEIGNQFYYSLSLKTLFQLERKSYYGMKYW